MERLTRRSDTGHAYYPRCFEEPCNRRCEDCLFDETICKRLAAYEDTGLEPEEVLPKDKADEIALKLMRLADLESLCSYDRLRELAEANKDERVVVLPCKVGQRVFALLDTDKHISECEVKQIVLGVETGSLVCLGCGYEHNCGIHGCAILRKTIACLERKLEEDRPSSVMEYRDEC